MYYYFLDYSFSVQLLLVCFMDNAWIFSHALQWFGGPCVNLWARPRLTGLESCQAFSRRTYEEYNWIELDLSALSQTRGWTVLSTLTLCFYGIFLLHQKCFSLLVHIPQDGCTCSKRLSFHCFICFDDPPKKQRFNYLWNKGKWNWESKYTWD